MDMIGLSLRLRAFITLRGGPSYVLPPIEQCASGNNKLKSRVGEWTTVPRVGSRFLHCRLSCLCFLFVFETPCARFSMTGGWESVRNCVDYRSGCRRRLRRFGAITSNDVLLHRGLQDDEDDRALRWKCRECGYISIIQLLQCVAQTCAVLQQKIDGP